jgi:hypothetical protein
MIHSFARKTVGYIELNSNLVGHAVLIGPRHAVTCAHVLSFEDQRPEGSYTVKFPNFNDMSRDMSVKAWRPYKGDLTSGSDIAILEWTEGQEITEWARLDLDRPPNETRVVALDYQIARTDGDVRYGCVHDRHGSVISLSGESFIESGVSGSGLFWPEPGERLLGIVSGKPKAHQQTTGYAIPADQIDAIFQKEIPSSQEQHHEIFCLDTDDDLAVFAASRLAKFDLLAPTQTARPDGNVNIQCTASFEPGATSTTLKEVELHLSAVRPLVKPLSCDNIGTFTLDARGTYRHRYWKIRHFDGKSLEGQLETQDTPLTIMQDAVEGDQVNARMTAFLNKIDCHDFDGMHLSDTRKRVLERLRLKDLGIPPNDSGDLLLGKVTGRIRRRRRS